MADGEQGYREQWQEPGELPDELVLAAVERAVRHRPGPRRRGERSSRRERGGERESWLDAAATTRDVRAHLSLATHSAAGRGLKARLSALEARGLLKRGREHGVESWALTDEGRELVARKGAPALPESPQHARWRHARGLARNESGRLAADLRDSLGSCARLLDRLEGPPGSLPHSDEWFELAERLRRDCRRVGSAQHILREWLEPEESRPDVDALTDSRDVRLGERLPIVRALRAGRRNTRLWRDRD